MNEAETRAEHIDPALKAAGWGVADGSRVLREAQCVIAPGRLQGRGQRAKAEIAKGTKADKTGVTTFVPFAGNALAPPGSPRFAAHRRLRHSASQMQRN